ncbi:methyltransferase domain-containing protein [Nocardioides sp. CER19]|uniref:methyltransferase domain-containing protein n=1 Tax=Nocardioides sp. CER19 TaxID=3038538 RepID=UPI002448FC73|nr:methyltransferase domain-containing protein [Nocardioides sp. CER19]MDH2414887.1 methyltransferase domain-containing protein [Nocardioides sp. CER19]
MPTYALGSNDAELARLEAQAAFIAEPTRVLLQASGIAAGMRVLDLGTGLGHVACAVGELVGPGGEVVGVDVDPHMLEVARSRSAHLPHVRFVEADVTQWSDGASYDAVVGRLILFHMADPVGVLRHHLSAVRPGGRVVFLDFDIGGLRSEPANRLSDELTSLVMTAFRAAGADPVIGSRLKLVLAQAGVEDVAGLGIAQYLSPDDPVGPPMLSAVVRSLAPVMVAHGLATEEDLALDTLPARLAESLRSTGSVIVPPLLVGAWGRRP